MKLIKNCALLLMSAAVAASCSTQPVKEHQYDIDYVVAFDTAHHYLDVTMRYSGEHPDTLTLKMPVWAPGYYEIQDFPKHLCDFASRDAEGNELEWVKQGKNSWRIVASGVEGDIIATYRIFANERDVASSRVDDKAAFIAPNGVFMYVEGEQVHPVTVTLDMPDNWHSVSTGMKADSTGVSKFYAPSFDVLFDSPLLLGNHRIDRFQHEGHAYEMAYETPEGVDESGFEDCFKKIVSAATDIMQDVPYDNYTLIHMGKGRGGLEHLNSQACYTDGTYRIPDHMEWLDFLGFVAHEYFHLYNVKTIRPIELGPFDYDREACTPLLWFSEGVTCYYEALLLYRAGIATEDEMLALISKYMKMDESHPGHLHQSLRQASYDIWLNFMNDDANSRDVRINYYFRGPVVGLIMDIEIKRLSAGRHSLDDLMRLLYNRFHKQMDRGFTEDEFWAAVDEVAGASMAHVRQIVDTPMEIDYDSFFRPAGLTLDRKEWRIKREGNN